MATCVAESYAPCTSYGLEPATTTMYLNETHFHVNVTFQELCEIPKRALHYITMHKTTVQRL